MAAKDKATLKADLNTSYPDNTAKFITPAKVRSQQTDAIDSPVNLAETALQTMAGPLSATNLLRAGKEITPSNEVIINQLSDFPTPTDTGDGNGTAIHLVDGVLYTLNTDITTSYSLVCPAAYGAGKIVSISGLRYSLTKTGSGPLITDSNKKFGFYELSDIIVSAPDSGGLIIDVESDDPNVLSYFSFRAIYGSDIDRVGYVRANCSLDVKFSRFVNCSHGLTLIDTDSVYIGASSWWTGWKNTVGSVKLTLEGTANDNIVMSGWAFENDTNEYGFDIKSTSDIQGANVSGGVIIGGNAFAPSSKTQTDVKWRFSGVSGVTNSYASAYMNALNQASVVTTLLANKVKRINATYTDDQERFITSSTGNATYVGIQDIKRQASMSISGTVVSGTNIPINFYICKGNTTNTITSFADAGGGQVTVTTSADHGYSNGDRIVIEDTTNYNGEYTISSVTANTYQITATWVSTQTGNHYKVQLFTKASNEFTSTQDSSTAWATLIEFFTNDIIFLAVENTSTSSGWKTSDIHFLIR